MTETAKERIYREFIETIATDKQGLKVIPLGELMEIAQITLEKAKDIPSSTEEISVDKLQEIRVAELKDFSRKILQGELKNQKLQEQLSTAKKALTEIAEFDCSDDCYFTARDALAVLEGGEDE